MRLIDADALIKTIDSHCYPVQHDMTSIEPGMTRIGILQAIQEQPTIEPERKKGRWIERNPQNSDKCRLIECDQCGFSHIVGFNVPYEHWIENRNFCERCGADMRGEQNE